MIINFVKYVSKFAYKNSIETEVCVTNEFTEHFKNSLIYQYRHEIGIWSYQIPFNCVPIVEATCTLIKLSTCKKMSRFNKLSECHLEQPVQVLFARLILTDHWSNN